MLVIYNRVFISRQSLFFFPLNSSRTAEVVTLSHTLINKQVINVNYIRMLIIFTLQNVTSFIYKATPLKSDWLSVAVAIKRPNSPSEIKDAIMSLALSLAKKSAFYVFKFHVECLECVSLFSVWINCHNDRKTGRVSMRLLTDANRLSHMTRMSTWLVLDLLR